MNPLSSWRSYFSHLSNGFTLLHHSKSYPLCVWPLTKVHYRHLRLSFHKRLLAKGKQRKNTIDIFYSRRCPFKCVHLFFWRSFLGLNLTKSNELSLIFPRLWRTMMVKSYSVSSKRHSDRSIGRYTWFLSSKTIKFSFIVLLNVRWQHKKDNAIWRSWLR